MMVPPAHAGGSDLIALTPHPHDGRLLADSTTEGVGFNNAIKSMVIEIAPAFAELTLIDSWAGLRPRAKDGLPGEALVYATGYHKI